MAETDHFDAVCDCCHDEPCACHRVEQDQAAQGASGAGQDGAVTPSPQISPAQGGPTDHEGGSRDHESGSNTVPGPDEIDLRDGAPTGSIARSAVHTMGPETAAPLDAPFSRGDSVGAGVLFTTGNGSSGRTASDDPFDAAGAAVPAPAGSPADNVAPAGNDTIDLRDGHLPHRSTAHGSSTSEPVPQQASTAQAPCSATEAAAPSRRSAAELRAAVEAVLMVVDEPVGPVSLASAIGVTVEHVKAILAELVADYDNSARGFELRRVAGGWRIYSRQDYADVVERFLIDGQTAKLTQAALETLAIVAYRQPVSRSRVGAVRGVNVDAVMRTLTTRGLVEEAGHDPETGAVLYATTQYFLQRIGLESIDQLPALAPYLPAADALEEIASGGPA